jgi:hypothetical protein
MRPIPVFLALALGCLVMSCDSRKRDTAYPEFMTNLAEAVRAYHSTNITVAEEGLLAYRRWLLDRAETDKTNSPGYYPSLYRTDARLFQLYEFKGQTNQADTFYREAVSVNSTVLRSKHLDDNGISKKQLQAELARQERNEDIGWKKVPSSRDPR